MKALVLTPSSLFRLSQFTMSREWFVEYELTSEFTDIKRVVINDIVYLIDKSLESDDGAIIVVDIESEEAVFNGDKSDVRTIERIITVARSIFTTSVAIPTSWKAHYEGTFLSITPGAFNNWRSRLHFQKNIGITKDLLVFGLTNEIVHFSKLSVPKELYSEARAYFVDAVLTDPPAPAQDNNNSSIVLTHRLPQGFIQGASLDQWYSSKLTKEQLEFVNKPHNGPIRLRGSAGTGKTLSLVIKFLRDGIRAEIDKANVRFGFLTHSIASVDLVSSISESLDPSGLIFGRGKNCTLEVRTLYDLASKHLQLSLDKLNPLSLDGQEGRRLQMDLIEEVLKEMALSPILPLQYANITPTIKERWLASSKEIDKRFIDEIMNEFASVLDAEGIRAGQEKSEKYVKNAVRRPAWLMALPTEIDRLFMLEIHRRYRKHLGEMNTLSVDQMIADFDSFLDSNRWDRIRSRDGYDVLFVDELHLFTAIERQTLHKLIKLTTNDEGKQKRPPIFMAYDLKQSPRDTFTQYGESGNNLFGASTGLQNSDLIQLNQVFRFTPQIAEFLADIDATFPAIDIPGEWDPYIGQAQLSDGSIPDLMVYPDDKTLFKTVFDAAHRCARSAEGGGRRVAVLCASEEMFDTYTKIANGQYKGKVLSITNREPSSELRHAGKRFIFSMPEYVAGLQFETVFLIHVDAQEAPNDAGIGARRRFISSIYLGASRAEKVLHLSASALRGGGSDILSMAIDRGNLIETVPSRQS